ncbi:MAG TPA: PRC-barrel domain-containing protein [Ktedonobacterales bacterium]|nr:PRC-barrel domain-containing protein [Ktedonobacterales bacterium]
MSQSPDQPNLLEDLRIDAHVLGRDGKRLGKLQRIVIAEADQRVTHLVVDPGLLASGNALAPGGWEKPRARLVPIALVQSANADGVTLDADEAAFATYPIFEQERATAVAPPADLAATPDRAHWWSRANLGDVINYLSSTVGAPYLSPDDAAQYDETPGEAEIIAGTAVWRRAPTPPAAPGATAAADAARHRFDETEIGVVERVLVDANTNRVSALVMRRKGLGGQLVVLPMEAVADLEDDLVHVTLTDAEVDALAPYHEP